MSDSVISAVAFAMGYSISSVQHNKTHLHRLCSSHLCFVEVQTFDPRKCRYHDKCLFLKSSYFYAKHIKPMKPLLVFRKQGIPCLYD